MAGVRPELIFVGGPQQGQRAVLMNNVVIAGRAADVDIRLHDETISRRQLQFTFTREGWIVENVSETRRIEINGKRFKMGKKILLDSGDVVRVGADTDLLFVNAEDDPNEVLETYRSEHPADQTEAQASSAAASADQPQTPSSARPEQSPPPPPDSLPEAPQPPAPPAGQAREEQPEEPEETAEEQEAREKKTKVKKYLILLVVWLGFLTVLVAVLTMLKSDTNGPSSSGMPRELTMDRIEQVLSSSLEQSPNEVTASARLSEARSLFRSRNAAPENLYLCVKNYRLFKAYRRPGQRIFEPEDERNYRIALDDLTDKVQDAYTTALGFTKAGRWGEARRQWDYLMRIVPINEVDNDPEVEEVLVKNILDFSNYVSRRGPGDD